MSELVEHSRPFDGRLRYGGDYYPEQWPKRVWEEDAALMAEAGVNLVTVGVFAWAMLEPSEGEFSFDWMKDVLDLLDSAGVGVDLATPTASPPPWLSVRYPSSLPVDELGCTYHHGSRQHFCVCSPDYLRLARNIVDRLVKAVGSHPAIEMFHMHNEYACHVPYCYCDNHEVAFRSWLERRYGSVEELNDAWGATFWGQRYGSFDEVSPPRRAPTVVNPSHQLDWRRFSNDCFLEQMQEELGLLRAARPELPVTTNFMGFFKPLDYFEWARSLDVVSTDNYPDPSEPASPMRSAMHYDLVRSLDKSKPWMVMEQTTSRVNWRTRNVAKLPGEMRAYCYQAIGRGAEGVLFFQWRAARAGAEKFHSAMIGHSGRPSPVWREVVALGRELAGLSELHGATVVSHVAICFSWPSWWAMEAPSQPLGELGVVGQLEWMYAPLYARGVTVDFCHPSEPLGSYDAVVVPSLYLLTEEEGANLAGYVESGGSALVTFWSGIVDARDQIYLGPYGGPLRRLFGGDVVEVTPLRSGESVEVEWQDGGRTAADMWIDVIDEGDGEVLARLASGPHEGRPAVLSSRCGAGRAVYVGTRLDTAGLERARRALPGMPPGVDPMSGDVLERVVRRREDHEFEFLINHSARSTTVDTSGRPGFDLVTRTAVRETLVLESRGVAIVSRPVARTIG